MKIGGDVSDMKHANLRGKMGVQRGGPRGRREPFWRHIGMRDLAVRVHSGIGPSGAVDDNGHAAQFQESAFEMILDGVAGGLALPAAEGAAVVGDQEAETLEGHGWRETVRTDFLLNGPLAASTGSFDCVRPPLRRGRTPLTMTCLRRQCRERRSPNQKSEI